MDNYWIWFFGDFEIYHSMKQNFSREERGYDWPAYWHTDTWNTNVKFIHSYDLDKEEFFHVTSKAIGYVKVNGQKFPLNQSIKCSAGHVEIEIIAASMSVLPSVFIKGDSIRSDGTWQVSNYLETIPAGFSSLYTDPAFYPDEICFSSETCEPKAIDALSGGVLIDFGRMIDGHLNVSLKDDSAAFDLCFGESVAEATDIRWCYYKEEDYSNGKPIRKRAFRYVFIVSASMDDIHSIGATHQFVDIPVRSSFHSDNKELNQIWDVSVETYRLCSGLFFIDGIKRDRWIWSGDAYQSYFVNPYVFADKEIEERTILALRGNKEIQQHLNTIVDYSLLWVISIEKHMREYAAADFLKSLWPKITAMMDFCEAQKDENGFIIGRPDDWIFIDWAEMDKTGPICAEQVLLYAAYKSMSYLCEVMQAENVYAEKADALKKKINTYYWDADKGAYIDSFQSGKRHITRHGNIFAVLFRIAGEQRTEQIIRNVLLNEEVAPITTPYFKFFELDALGQIGRFDLIWSQLFSYWGGMLQKGAVTFWEQYDPSVEGNEHYAMYGDPFGKSLCHAWSASPIYFIGRYLIGMQTLAPDSVSLDPHVEFLNQFDCVLPIGKYMISFTMLNHKLTITTTMKRGKLYYKDKCYELCRDASLTLVL